MITISKFKNKSVAMNYYNIMIKNHVFATHLSAKDFVIYSMSASNYTTYYNMKDKRDMYPEFFNDNYLNDNK